MQHQIPAALTLAEILWRLGLAFLLVAANGFFVAAEFALVGARRTRIDGLAAQGVRRAKSSGSRWPRWAWAGSARVPWP